MKEVRVSQRHAFSSGTHSNLRSQFRSYFGFCVYFKRTPLPANLDTICGYAQFLSRSLKSTSISNYLSGVKMLHILLGYEYVFTGNGILRLVLRGISRLNPHFPDRAPPMTPEILLKLFRTLDHQNSLECSVFACGLLLFFTMSRLGSILPAHKKVPQHKFLTISRVNLCSVGLLVTLAHTKTIQFGERMLHIPLIRTDSPLCPVAAFAHAQTLARNTSLVHAFSFREADGSVSMLLASLFVTTIRSLLSRAGVADAHSYRGHSFRRGGASWAFNSGVPGELIQVCGDWKSEAYKVYLEFSMASKVTIAQQISRYLPSFV